MIEAIIFDYARTLVDIDANSPRLYPGVEDMLKTLKGRGLKMALVSRGQDIQSRTKEIEDLGLVKYFDAIEVVGADGNKDFRPLVEKLKVKSQNCVVFGDRVKSEILQGNLMGMTTIWLREKGGKFANELPAIAAEIPQYTVTYREQFIKILDSIP